MAVLLHAFLHTVEQVFRNDSRNAALNYNILIAILANVFAVFQQRAECRFVNDVLHIRERKKDVFGGVPVERSHREIVVLSLSDG